MLDRRNDDPNPLVDLARSLPATTPPSPKSTAARYLAATVGQFTAIPFIFLGFLMFFANPFVGVPVFLRAFGAALYCAHYREDLQRERKWHGPRPHPSYLSRSSAPLPQPDPRVTLIQAIKEVELAKMHLPHDERKHVRETQTTVQVTEMQTQAQVESARWTALGAAGALNQDLERLREDRQWTANEAQKERDWKSAEAELDRKLTIDQLITKFEGQIREIELRLQYERPDAASKSREEMVRLKGRLAQLEEINKLRDTDPVLHRQLFEQFRRGFE